LIRDLRAGLQRQVEQGAVEVERTSECFGACHRAPMARIGDQYHENLDTAARERLIAEVQTAER
jgi:NADH:ubiquinone oxidoreductase subunit E